MSGDVVMVEHVGADSIIAVRLKDGRTAHDEDGDLDAVMVTVPGYCDLSIGQPVWATIDLGQAIFFAAKTGSAFAHKPMRFVGVAVFELKT